MARTLLLALSCGAASAQPAPAPVQVPDTLAQRLQPCMTCHGREGRASRLGYLPRIAGKPAGYLYNQLLNFRDGRRANATMADLLAHQTDAYLAEMAGHFAALDLPYPPPTPDDTPAALLARGEALVRRGDASRRLPACAACHGEQLTGRQPAVPGLLGLPRDYLIGQLGAWQTNGRRAHAPDCMAQVAQQLTAADVGAVTAWLVRQPVPVPAHAAAPSREPLPLDCGRQVAPPEPAAAR
jgi:cytochrome c553